MRRVMIDLLRMHRANDADVIRDGRNVRKEVRNVLAGLAVFLEARERPASFQCRILQLSELLTLGERFRKRLTINLLQLRFVIETFQMRRSARHAKMNDAFGTDRKMRRVDNAFSAMFNGRGFCAARQVCFEQAGGPGTAQTRGPPAREPAAAEV